MKRAILAGTYQQFLNWCKENMVSPLSRDVFYIADRDSLLGLHDVEVIKYGTWYERTDLEDIEQALFGRDPDFARVEVFENEDVQRIHGGNCVIKIGDYPVRVYQFIYEANNDVVALNAALSAAFQKALDKRDDEWRKALGYKNGWTPEEITKMGEGLDAIRQAKGGGNG